MICFLLTINSSRSGANIQIIHKYTPNGAKKLNNIYGKQTFVTFDFLMKVSLIQPLMQMRPIDTEVKTRMASSLGLLTVARTIRKSGGADGYDRIEIVNENVGDTIQYNTIQYNTTNRLILSALQ